MKNVRKDLPDPARTNLRAVVASIDGTLSSLSGQSTPEEAKTNLETLTASWGDLVNQLALGPEPEYRECPKCRHISMRQATLCGHCWAQLSPPAPLAPGESQDRMIVSA